jgi:hypothetical protein
MSGELIREARVRTLSIGSCASTLSQSLQSIHVTCCIAFIKQRNAIVPALRGHVLLNSALLCQQVYLPLSITVNQTTLSHVRMLNLNTSERNTTTSMPRPRAEPECTQRCMASQNLTLRSIVVFRLNCKYMYEGLSASMQSCDHEISGQSDFPDNKSVICATFWVFASTWASVRVKSASNTGSSAHGR